MLYVNKRSPSNVLSIFIQYKNWPESDMKPEVSRIYYQCCRTSHPPKKYQVVFSSTYTFFPKAFSTLSQYYNLFKTPTTQIHLQTYYKVCFWLFYTKVQQELQHRKLIQQYSMLYVLSLLKRFVKKATKFCAFIYVRIAYVLIYIKTCKLDN